MRKDDISKERPALQNESREETSSSQLATKLSLLKLSKINEIEAEQQSTSCSSTQISECDVATAETQVQKVSCKRSKEEEEAKHKSVSKDDISKEGPKAQHNEIRGDTSFSAQGERVSLEKLIQNHEIEEGQQSTSGSYTQVSECDIATADTQAQKASCKRSKEEAPQQSVTKDDICQKALQNESREETSISQLAMKLSLQFPSSMSEMMEIEEGQQSTSSSSTQIMEWDVATADTQGQKVSHKRSKEEAPQQSVTKDDICQKALQNESREETSISQLAMKLSLQFPSSMSEMMEIEEGQQSTSSSSTQIMDWDVATADTQGQKASCKRSRLKKSFSLRAKKVFIPSLSPIYEIEEEQQSNSGSFTQINECPVATAETQVQKVSCKRSKEEEEEEEEALPRKKARKDDVSKERPKAQHNEIREGTSFSAQGEKVSLKKLSQNNEIEEGQQSTSCSSTHISECDVATAEIQGQKASRKRRRTGEEEEAPPRKKARKDKIRPKAFLNSRRVKTSFSS